MIAHRGAVNTVLDVNERSAVTACNRVLALSSLSFDLSVYDVFGLLAAGGAIVIPAASASRDPARWLDVMTREKVTLWNSVPALAQLLVEHVEVRGQNIGDSLRLVMLSGDWIPVQLPGAICARAPRACVMSLGGATEASIWSVLHPTDGVPADATSIPYGKAMANQHMYVFDDALEPRPIWVPGEIYIGGVGVAEGYFRDPTRTAERFLMHPRTGERLYRTGDVGRLLPDGAIEFMGREDSQVKVQGFRIELGEVERTLERAPGVRAAVVMPVGEKREAKSLAAYVVPVDLEDRPDPAGLRRILGESLPAYMVPASVTIVDALPLTSNGKVDRSRLGRLDGAERPAFVAPRDATEHALADLWREVLGVDSIGADDDFFALGGHSLVAVRLRRRSGRPVRARATHLVVSRQLDARRSGVAPARRGRASAEHRLSGVGGELLAGHAARARAPGRRERALLPRARAGAGRLWWRRVRHPGRRRGQRTMHRRRSPRWRRGTSRRYAESRRTAPTASAVGRSADSWP